MSGCTPASRAFGAGIVAGGGVRAADGGATSRPIVVNEAAVRAGEAFVIGS
jgi:hypothetical protein